MIKKNKDRELPTFANINLLGKCNADCFFCLGKDIKEHLKGKNHLDIHFSEWKNFEYFLTECKLANIKKLYLTGQTADGLQYKFLNKIVNYLQNRNFSVGVRTNGYLAERNMDIIHKMKDEIGYSIHSLDFSTNKLIMGRRDIPNWDKIIPNSGENVRVSIVLNRYNVNEFYKIVKYLSSFPNIKYIQVRRISTDTRIEELKDDISIYENFFETFSKSHIKTGDFYLAEQYELYGKEINFWRTVETSCNSFNYFTDGTFSKKYFIVEGYLENQLHKV